LRRPPDSAASEGTKRVHPRPAHGGSLLPLSREGRVWMVRLG